MKVALFFLGLGLFVLFVGGLLGANHRSDHER